MKTNEQFSGVTRRVHTLWNVILDNRMAQAKREGVSRYPIYRVLHFAARIELDVLLDAIALDPAWCAERVGYEELLLDSDGLFIVGYGNRKVDYCSCSFYIWAADVARAEEAKQRILDKAGSTRITEPMFRIEWTFVTSHGLESAWIEEMADDVLRDRAYPEIAGGVRGFIGRYLASPEAVLVLQGPPGTGKSRLIRAILGEMSRRKGEDAAALYTSDIRALDGDEIFVKFITGRQDAFVIEDADHLLKPRADGNDHLHRFLTIADGVVRSQGRKVIFSTNLPNVGDLDDALIRPGRCFARIHVRSLSSAEAQALAAEIAGGDAEKLARASLALAAGEGSRRSLAEVYRALR
ncbi:MAG TPA: AAA family ATPase [Burkholderiales bacterium]|nr:AAA family ATPase [Burkholderiales bacterium]